MARLKGHTSGKFYTLFILCALERAKSRRWAACENAGQGGRRHGARCATARRSPSCGPTCIHGRYGALCGIGGAVGVAGSRRIDTGVMALTDDHDGDVWETLFRPEVGMARRKPCVTAEARSQEPLRTVIRRCHRGRRGACRGMLSVLPASFKDEDGI